MRSPQPEQRVRVVVKRAKVRSRAVLRALSRRARLAIGSNRSASAGGGGAGLLRSRAAVFGVVMVRVKVLGVAPGGRLAGLKEAVAMLGRPVAVRLMALERVVPWIWTAKVNVAELPERMVWVVEPVLLMVKSGLGLVPIPMSLGV